MEPLDNPVKDYGMGHSADRDADAGQCVQSINYIDYVG